MIDSYILKKRNAECKHLAIALPDTSEQGKSDQWSEERLLKRSLLVKVKHAPLRLSRATQHFVNPDGGASPLGDTPHYRVLSGNCTSLSDGSACFITGSMVGRVWGAGQGGLGGSTLSWWAENTPGRDTQVRV